MLTGKIVCRGKQFGFTCTFFSTFFFCLPVAVVVVVGVAALSLLLLLLLVLLLFVLLFCVRFAVCCFVFVVFLFSFSCCCFFGFGLLLINTRFVVRSAAASLLAPPVAAAAAACTRLAARSLLKSFVLRVSWATFLLLMFIYLICTSFMKCLHLCLVFFCIIYELHLQLLLEHQ